MECNAKLNKTEKNLSECLQFFLKCIIVQLPTLYIILFSALQSDFLYLTAVFLVLIAPCIIKTILKIYGIK